MWKHKECGGQIVPGEDYDVCYCLNCNQSPQSNGEVYLDHYIINIDGKPLANQEAI